ncbi:MAG: excinuclease ABC subunit UvrA, partial [Firmicutes bacterium]|nr:excinuclease ABC subunit UvrA [Bacillota bacterium]
MAIDKIIVRGAHEHNLKNIDVEIPRDKLVVITGLSGSGKSSLAFDTIYAEGQRRYMESLSSYARQFLGQMEKPAVDYIEGLSPAISIDQKTTSKNPRSTVGTVTEIHDYLRLLYARIGEPHCPQCGRKIEKQSVDQIADIISALPLGSRIQIMAPIVRGRKGEYKTLFADLKQDGFVRVRVDGELRLLEEEITLNKQQKHNIELVVDRLIIKETMDSRLYESIETALQYGEGLMLLVMTVPGEEGEKEELFSQNFACPDCGISIEEITPRSFSFNNPFGACPDCTGLGFSMYIDENLIIADAEKSVAEGGLMRWSEHVPGWYLRHIEAVFKAHGYSMHVPIKDLPRQALDEIFYGCGNERFDVPFSSSTQGEQIWNHRWEGLINNLNRRYHSTDSPAIKEEIEKLMTHKECPTCDGARLKPTSLAVT